MTLQDLAVDHDYYSSDTNFYCREVAGRYPVWTDFYDYFIDADIDMNLIFRWDIHKRDKSDRYWMEVFMIHQRKGIYHPFIIDYVDEKDVESIVELLSKHWKKLQDIWIPVT